MANGSVATAGSSHGLWIGPDSVLTVHIDKCSNQFPPDLEQCRRLNCMIQGLARAARATIYQAENDQGSADFLMQPIENIADAIVILSQLSQAIFDETSGREVGA